MPLGSAKTQRVNELKSLIPKPIELVQALQMSTPHPHPRPVRETELQCGKAKHIATQLIHLARVVTQLSSCDESKGLIIFLTLKWDKGVKVLAREPKGKGRNHLQKLFLNHFNLVGWRHFTLKTDGSDQNVTAEAQLG